MAEKRFLWSFLLKSTCSSNLWDFILNQVCDWVNWDFVYGSCDMYVVYIKMACSCLLTKMSSESWREEMCNPLNDKFISQRRNELHIYHLMQIELQSYFKGTTWDKNQIEANFLFSAHEGWDKMAAILHSIFKCIFLKKKMYFDSNYKMFVFQFKCFDGCSSNSEGSNFLIVFDQLMAWCLSGDKPFLGHNELTHFHLLPDYIFYCIFLGKKYVFWFELDQSFFLCVQLSRSHFWVWWWLGAE